MRTLSRFSLVLFHFMVDLGSSRLEASSMAGTSSSSGGRSSSVTKWTKAAKKLQAKGSISDKGRGGESGEFVSLANPDLKVKASKIL